MHVPRFALFFLFLAGIPAHSEDLVTSIGKQRAASSPLQWEIREASHPRLGLIRFAFLKSPIATPVGNAKVSSNVYVSCEKGARKIAIELANATSADDPGGLQPKTMPRLVCNTLAAPNDPKVVQDDVTAHWEVSPIGDVLARGLSPFALRECVSIRIVQEVVLPKGWARPSAPVAFEIAPYDRELDSIFATCGEITAYASTPPAASVAPVAPPAAAIAHPPLKPAESAEMAWKQARTTSRGRTNVRASPNLNSAVVIELYPGDIVLVQRTGNEWWRVKSRPGRPAFEGYIRQDRLVFSRG
jgi:hypothetical protein